MNVLLVTKSEQLAEKLAVLSPELEYCAIVVDKVELAKEVLGHVGLPRDLIYPMNKLKHCIESFQYDYFLCVQENAYSLNFFKTLLKYNLPKEKVVGFSPILRNWETERHLRYYKKHSQEIEMFATGTSYTEAGIDIKCFKHKTINFGTSSQDLYYSFQIAKSVVLYGGGV